MVNLPGSRPEMVAADFEGVTEALKGQREVKVCPNIFAVTDICAAFCSFTSLPWLVTFEVRNLRSSYSHLQVS